MAGLRKRVIASRLTELVSNAGCHITEAKFSGGYGDLPWTCAITFPDGAERRYSLYFWTISHGGRTRSQSEYRIQAKLRTSRALEFIGGTTLLLGYYSADYDNVGRDEGNAPYDNMEVFVAWDPLQHLRIGASSSCQVSFDLLQRAFLDGFAITERRTNEDVERVVAIQAQNISRYLRAAAGGHNSIALKDIACYPS